jgi:SM-20-related protein
MNYTQASITELADALAEQELVILDQFLAPEEWKAILEAFTFYADSNAFKPAGIGNTYLYTQDKSVRSDRIKWLAKSPENSALAEFSKRIHQLMEALKPQLFLSLRDIEMHLAEYPPGAHYDKHVDQFKLNGHRILSFACYLNPSWSSGDGGELRIHHDYHFFDISPIAGRLVLFRSDTVLHEVLPSKAMRRSITGWMLDRPIDYPVQE